MHPATVRAAAERASVHGSASPALDCRGVSFRYGERWANQEVDLRVARGEIFCLLGPNGAGKTTLLKQITGQLRPTRGRIMVLGVDVAHRPQEAKRKLGILPQDAGLFEALTVEEHLRHFAALKGLPRSTRAAELETLSVECALAGLMRRRVFQLSVGEKRRLLVALALLGDPPVLVMDEPTVGLDPVVRRAVWQLLDRQRARNRAILLTTHYLDEAEQLADRVAFVEAGRIARCGSLEELYRALGKTIKVIEVDGDTGRSAVTTVSTRWKRLTRSSPSGG